MSTQLKSYVTNADHPSPAGTKPITAERYISRDFLEREFELVFGKMWLMAGLESDLSGPGDYFVFDIGRESIVVARTDGGEVAASYNVCQHRGCRVMTNPLGAVDKFVCPYHSWTYELDGSLSYAPDEDRFSNGVPYEELSLRPVRCEVWAGMVWVCMHDDAPDLSEFLGPVKEMIEPFRPQDMTLESDQTVHLECNWKAALDNFQELYHVEHIHPQHGLIFDCLHCDTDLLDWGHDRVVIEGFTVNTRQPVPDYPTEHMIPMMESLGLNPDDFKGRVLDVRQAVQEKRRELGPAMGQSYDLLSDDRLSDIEQYNLFPNMVIALQPESMSVMRALPDPTNPDKCCWHKFTFVMEPDPNISKKVHVSFLADKERAATSGERPEPDEFDQEEIIAGRKSIGLTNDQDIHFIRDVQKGMHSKAFRRAWLNDDECRVQHYHDWYNYFMGIE